MLATMYRWGAPPSVDALEALMIVEAEQADWRTYMADMVCKIATKVSRGQLPYYSQLAKRGAPKTDSRTGQEIVDSIIARRRNKRRVGGEKR